MPENAALIAEGQAIRAAITDARADLASLRTTQISIEKQLRAEMSRSRRWRAVTAALVMLGIAVTLVAKDSRDTARTAGVAADQAQVAAGQAKLISAQLRDVIDRQAASDQAARVRDCESRNETRAQAASVWADQVSFTAFLLTSLAPDPSKLRPAQREALNELVTRLDAQQEKINTTYAAKDCSKL